MKHLRKETDNARQTITRGKGRCHRRARSEDRSRGQSRHTGPRARSEDRGRGRGRHTWAPSADLASPPGDRIHQAVQRRHQTRIHRRAPPGQQQPADPLGPGPATDHPADHTEHQHGGEDQAVQRGQAEPGTRAVGTAPAETFTAHLSMFTTAPITAPRRRGTRSAPRSRPGRHHSGHVSQLRPRACEISLSSDRKSSHIGPAPALAAAGPQRPAVAVEKPCRARPSHRAASHETGILGQARAGGHDLPNSSQYGNSSHPPSMMRAVSGASELALHLWAILGSNQ